MKGFSILGGLAVAAFAGVCLLGATASADEQGIAGKKLLVIDKIVSSGKAKIVWVAKDPQIHVGSSAAGVADIDAELVLFYNAAGLPAGTVSMPAPWFKVSSKVAKYKNALAPLGPSVAKVAGIKPGKTAKVVTKGLGGMDISSPPGAGGVVTMLTVHNAADASTHRFCTLYSTGVGSTILYKPIAAGTGRKLLLKNGVGTACPQSCSDGLQNQDESDVDCGGSTCPSCPDGSGCGTGGDCSSGVCSLGTCQVPSCSDGVQNGNETDVDCGGGTCGLCVGGEGCGLGSDCTSSVCTANICNAADCTEKGSCIMFVTSSSGDGDLGGLAGADAECNLRALAGGLCGGSGQVACGYQAWMCDGTTAPANRSTQNSVPYVRSDGATIAINWADLTDGGLNNPINRTETGASVAATAPFLPWTYVQTNGTCDNETYLSPGSGPCPAFSNCPTNCDNNGAGTSGWDSGSGLVQGSKGDINATNGNWTDGVTGLCSTPAERIYCIEQ